MMSREEVHEAASRRLQGSWRRDCDLFAARRADDQDRWRSLFLRMLGVTTDPIALFGELDRGWIALFSREVVAVSGPRDAATRLPLESITSVRPDYGALRSEGGTYARGQLIPLKFMLKDGTAVTSGRLPLEAFHAWLAVMNFLARFGPTLDSCRPD